MRAIALRIYRALLALVPGDLARCYGDEMVRFLGEAMDDAVRRRGWRAAVGVFGEAVLDLLRRTPYEHWLRRERANRRGRAMNALPQDVRYAVRGLRRQPGVTALLVGTLALGIAAAIAVFTMVNAIVLRPLPFRAADRLVYVNETAPRWNLRYTGINYPDFVQWRKAIRVFDGVALFQGASVNLADRTGSDRVLGGLMTYDLPKVLGLEPILGRTFSPEEDRPNGPKVVLLGAGLWRSRFGAARDVVGRTPRINSEPYTIVGVLP